MTAADLIHMKASTHARKENKLEEVCNVLIQNVDLELLNIEGLDLIIENGPVAGRQFAEFLNMMGQSISDRLAGARTVEIERKQLFDPVQFMHHRGLEIAEQDERSVMLEKIDVSKIALVSMLHNDIVITGDEHLRRLKNTGHIRLDARIFQTLWENQEFIPELWKGTAHSAKHVFFDGTILKNQHGRYVIGMYWDRDNRWNWTYCRLDIGGWRSEDLSAVLKI
ncbi:MAG TPA: hypothetical protein VHO84_06025 [Syntrophorhabdaceae bacterium]|nr:hypothetical protein [Syntrophorhabdaceae bacterium]